ncbi:MAG: hypothetical protein IPJ37_02580 [Bacteroidales bacterium]|nr:hypothetical protein [Bacteroidales bacterium]
MDCYDAHPKYTGGSNLTIADHPIPGVSTCPLWDPQRRSLGNTLLFANKMKYLEDTQPTEDTNMCSTGYCLYSIGKEYIAYQPDVSGSITLDLAKGSYKVETLILTTVLPKHQKSVVGLVAKEPSRNPRM